MLVEVLGFINLLCAGILAGEEFVICYGVRGPVACLGPQPGIQLREALIRRLRVLIPAIFGLAIFRNSGDIAEELRPRAGLPLRGFVRSRSVHLDYSSGRSTDKSGRV
jgi:hypothetical protein